MPTPTENDVKTTQEFKKVPVVVPEIERPKDAPPLRPNPFTGLPTKKRGKVVTPEGWTGA